MLNDKKKKEIEKKIKKNVKTSKFQMSQLFSVQSVLLTVKYST